MNTAKHDRRSQLFRIVSPAFLLVSMVMGACGQAQPTGTLTLDSCQAKAERNYPLTAKRGLLKIAEEYTVANASKGYLPRLSVQGKASYQSDVPGFGDSPSGALFLEISKDQYNIYGDVYQPLTDLYTVSQRKKATEIRAEIAQRNLEADLYKLESRVDQIFFGILLLDEQIAVSHVLQAKIKSALTATQTAVDNGIRLQSDAFELKAELLGAMQHETELTSAREGFADMLAQFIGEPVTPETEMAVPVDKGLSTQINRPELAVFDAQRRVLPIEDNLNKARTFPKIGLFFQGGYASPPPVNFLLPDWDWFYLGGLRLSWSIDGYYTRHKDKGLTQIKLRTVDTQRATFLFDTRLNMKRQTSEITKYKKLIARDAEIISLREEVTKTARSQLNNGTITVTEFIQKTNAEDLARRDEAIHRVQMLQAKYTYNHTVGN